MIWYFIQNNIYKNYQDQFQETTSKLLYNSASLKTQETSEVTFRTYTNDGSETSNEALIILKNIFGCQLPKMPREYIVRLVFDRRHRTLAIHKNGEILGGICYRPYEEQRFAEIAFCAVNATEQVQGYGTRMMNKLKSEIIEQSELLLRASYKAIFISCIRFGVFPDICGQLRPQVLHEARILFKADLT